ncbi:MAG TPA: hypothetical protein VLG68_06395 [Gammaproteobacteria bacterium]|nr:hypothetical protein [Gammaproteobacteria bacterium]
MADSNLIKCGLAASLLYLLPALAIVAGPRTGAFTMSFTQTTSLADGDEIAHRMLHRIVYEDRRSNHEVLAGQSIDPTKESWQVYVPESYTGAEAYGVLVWVSPFDSGRLPDGWRNGLEDHKLIYVGADRSGNGQGVMDRRVPLALTGLANIEAAYKVDSARIYIGGFSGGGVTASRIAAAYADVFTGGLYVSTSEGIGTEDVPVPSSDRYVLMQTRNRYAFTSGDEEGTNKIMNTRAEDAYRGLCVLRLEFIHIPNATHANLEPRYFSRALKFLDEPKPVDPADQADCEKQRDGRRAAAIDAIRQAFTAGDRDKAHDLLIALHQSFGPLAEPEFSHYAGCLNGNTLSTDCLGKPTGGG